MLSDRAPFLSKLPDIVAALPANTLRQRGFNHMNSRKEIWDNQWMHSSWVIYVRYIWMGFVCTILFQSTSQCRVVLEQQTVAQLVKTLPAYSLKLPVRTRPDESNLHLRAISILFSHLRLGPPSYHFLAVFRLKYRTYFSTLPHTFHT
jgi:hypothetical protein